MGTALFYLGSAIGFGSWVFGLLNLYPDIYIEDSVGTQTRRPILALLGMLIGGVLASFGRFLS